MQLRPAKSNTEWDEFVGPHPQTTFLQSYRWGQFQASLGRPAHYLLWEDEGAIIAACLVIEQELIGPFKFLYSPHPLLYSPSMHPAQAVSILASLKEWAKSQPRAVFFRIEPNETLNNVAMSAIYIEAGFKKSAKEAQPHNVWKLSLKLSEGELLTEMKPKTRYNIRIAIRDGVTITEGSLENFDDFLKVLKLTGQREELKLHSDVYYRKQFEALAPSEQKLYLAYKDERPIAGILLSYFGHEAVYTHGGSDMEFRQLMAPYLLHWTAIKKAKEDGKTLYDFGGITFEEGHAWAGITRFKQGFGGAAVSYLSTFELTLNQPVYFLYKTLGKFL
jgi:peptidoglycan pentaglycine glycine transferase (the first glycine)